MECDYIKENRAIMETPNDIIRLKFIQIVRIIEFILSRNYSSPIITPEQRSGCFGDVAHIKA